MEHHPLRKRADVLLRSGNPFPVLCNPDEGLARFASASISVGVGANEVMN